MPNQMRSAKLYPAAASNSCMARESDDLPIEKLQIRHLALNLGAL
jgi:hypothetical protein